jgi:hypothetical protein
MRGKNEDTSSAKRETDSVTGVRVGAYVLEVGPDCRSFTRYAPKREKENARKLAHAFEESERDDLSPSVAALERLDESAADVTEKIEHAHALFRNVLSGRFGRDDMMREIDGLLRLSERLDRAGRYEEQVRLARALHGLLATMFRWLDLLRTLRRALRSAKAVNDQAGQAWALHELGTLHLSAGDPRRAEELFRQALRTPQQAGSVASCTTRHNLDCARRDLPEGPAIHGPPNGGGSWPAAKGIAVLVVVAIVMAVAGIAAGVALSRDEGVVDPRLAQDALSFGAVTVGEMSRPKAVVVRAGSEALRVGSFTVDRPDEFLVDSRCPAFLDPGEPCKLVVRFRPSAGGQRATELRIGLGGGGSLSADLEGVGIPIVAASLAPARVDLGTTDVQARSPARTLSLRAGTKPLTRVEVATDSDEFRVDDECARTLEAGATCLIHVTFAPTGSGMRAATLTVTSSSGDVLSTELVGTGIDPARPTPEDPPTLTPSLRFGEVELGGSAAARILLTAGSKPLDVLELASGSSEFRVADHCLRPLPARATCAIEVTFLPTVAGASRATLTVTHEAGQRLESELLGTGVKPPPPGNEPTLTSSVDLGESVIGIHSPAGTVVLTAGSEPLTIAQVETGSPEFQADAHCPQPLGAGESCPIRVVFTPAADGPRTSQLTVTLADGRTLTSALSGFGIPGDPPTLERSLELGQVEVGSRSPAKTLMLTAGSKPLSIVDVATDAHEFRARHLCPSTLEPGRACAISVVFAPAAAGPADATLTVEVEGGPSLTSLLTGTGVPEVPPTLGRPLDLGEVELGSRSAAMTLILASGSKSLAIRRISSDSRREFRVADNCPERLEARSSCTIEVVFAPVVAEPRSSTLEVELAGREPLRSRLTGIGLAPPSVLPSSVNFGNVVVRSRKMAKLRVRAGSKPLTVIGIRTSDPKYFTASSTCDATLEPGASCSISLLFRPLARGVRRAILTVALSDRAPLTVPIVGVGVEAVIALDPPSLDFGSVVSDMPDSVTKEVRMTNVGDAPLVIDAITSSNRQFSVKNDCLGTLDPGATCSFFVTFNPSQASRQTATITIAANGRGPHTLTATGEGVVG